MNVTCIRDDVNEARHMGNTRLGAKMKSVSSGQPLMPLKNSHVHVNEGRPGVDVIV